MADTNNLSNVLYNVNRIVVQPGQQCEYIEFSNQLNRWAQHAYPRYYIGDQIYQDPTDTNVFVVVALYSNTPGICEAATKLGNEISQIYQRVWGDCVARSSISSFLTWWRVL